MVIQTLLNLSRYDLEEAALFIDEYQERILLNWLDRLALKKMGWELFLKEVKDPLRISRLASTVNGQSILHLAVLDDRLEIVQALRRDLSLKSRRNAFGLNPIELAQFLNRKEALRLLAPLSEMTSFPQFPLLEKFEYLSHPVFETREGFEKVLAETAKAKQEDQIPAEKIWMGIYFDKEIRKGSHQPISIRHIDDEVGYGVFAEQKISPCAFVGEYTGVIQERKSKQLIEKKYCLRYTIWEGKKNFAIDAEEKGNFSRFINHSTKPNLGLQLVYWRGLPRMIFVALREAREGDQLTFDYGPIFWKNLKQIPKDL